MDSLKCTRLQRLEDNGPRSTEEDRCLGSAIGRADRRLGELPVSGMISAHEQGHAIARQEDGVRRFGDHSAHVACVHYRARATVPRLRWPGPDEGLGEPGVAAPT